MPQEVWLPLATLVLGYVFSLLTESFRDRRQSRRERQAREDEREAIKAAKLEETESRRREFQRETLLELQEVLHQLGRAYGYEHSLDVQNYRQTGQWLPRPLVSEEMNRMALEANQRSNILVARLDDDDLRTLVRHMKDAGGRLSLAKSETDSKAFMDDSVAAFGAANEHIGQLLRTI